MENVNFEEITLNSKITSRGGGIEISLDSLGYAGQKMTAYQNYLGGGMLGRVCNDCTLLKAVWKSDPVLVDIAEKLAIYFHSLTNPEGYESTTFEENQGMLIRAY